MNPLFIDLVTAVRKWFAGDSSVGAAQIRSAGERSTGENELQKQCNPFYVDARRGGAYVVAGLIIATVIYWGLVFGLTSNLRNSIEKADALTDLLRVSPLYPDRGLPQAVAANERTETNELAIAIWIQSLKLSDASIEEILADDDRLKLLKGAIRYGDHCEGPRGTLQPLSMPTVERIVRLGAFLSANCDTRTGQGSIKTDAANLAQSVMYGGSSGKELFKNILRAQTAYNGLEAKIDIGNAEPESVRQAHQTLNSAEAELRAASDADQKNPAVKQRVDQAQKRKDEATANLARVRSSKQADDYALATQARKSLQALYAYTTPKVESNDTLNDQMLGAIEQFAIALITSIEADADVTKSRQWLAAVRGYEQYWILALFLITAFLMMERYRAFRHHRSNVVNQIEKLQEAVGTIRTDHSIAEEGETANAARRRRREGQAEIARLLLVAVPTTGDKPSELVVDMVRAMRSDLSQVHLHGLSDDRVDKVAEDLKDKISASRQGIEWAVTTLPALGFLGTVRGILLALSAIGGLNQGDSAARLGALLEVSSALGLAFATTLFALIFLIILSYCDIRQARSEKALVDQLRDFMNDRIVAVSERIQ